MRVAKPGLEAACERLIGQQRVEIHRRLGNTDSMPFRRDGRMQVGQRLGIIEPRAFRHESVDEVEDAVGAVGEAAHDLMCVNAGMFAALVEPGFGARRILGRGQIEKGEEVAGLVMRAGFLEIGLAFGIDQRRGAVGEHAGGIGRSAVPLCLDEDGPAGAEAAKGIVEAAGDRDQLGRYGAVEVRSAKACRALQAAVLVQYDAFADQRDPGKEVGEPGVTITIFGKVHHRCRSSDRQVAGDAQMLAHDVDELRIALGCPDGREVPHRPKGETH